MRRGLASNSEGRRIIASNVESVVAQSSTKEMSGASSIYFEDDASAEPRFEADDTTRSIATQKRSSLLTELEGA